MSFPGDKVPKGYGTYQLQQFTPEQMKLLSQRIAELGPDGFLSKIAGGDQSAFAEMEAPAKRQFNETIGNLGSRFASFGTGALKSSGFQNTANQAASDFASDLASKRSEMRMQAIRDLQGASNSLLSQRPYERGLYQKPQKQGWGGVAGAAIGGAGGFALGGPAGAMAGAQTGYNIGSGGQGGSANFQGMFGQDKNGLDWLASNLSGGV